jgi:Protein of unknown function (DUF3179)
MKALGHVHRTGFTVVGCFVVAAVVAVGINVLDRPRPSPSVDSPNFGAMATPFVWPARIQPPTVSAAAANLPDDEPVIGIVSHSKSRAYRIKAFAGMTNHVVNDVLDGVPVSVTHCDRDGCSRVYTGPGVEPLKIVTGGYANGLLLLIDGVFYHQTDGRPTYDPDGSRLPHELHKFEETTWGKWRVAHPDTDVFIDAPPGNPSTGRE